MKKNSALRGINVGLGVGVVGQNATLSLRPILLLDEDKISRESLWDLGLKPVCNIVYFVNKIKNTKPNGLVRTQTRTPTHTYMLWYDIWHDMTWSWLDMIWSIIWYIVATSIYYFRIKYCRNQRAIFSHGHWIYKQFKCD